MMTTKLLKMWSEIGIKEEQAVTIVIEKGVATIVVVH